MIDIRVNLIDEPLPITVSDKSCETQAVGISLANGRAEILLSLNDASVLQKKLLMQVTRQKARMIGEGAVRMLSKRSWVKRILVCPFSNGEVNLLVETPEEEHGLPLTREVITIGMVLGKAADAYINSHVSKVGQGIGQDEIVVFERYEGPEPTDC